MPIHAEQKTVYVCLFLVSKQLIATIFCHFLLAQTFASLLASKESRRTEWVVSMLSGGIYHLVDDYQSHLPLFIKFKSPYKLLHSIE